MIDVNLMCPIPLLIFLIRGKECFICREGDEMGCDALLHSGTAKPDCSPRVPVNLGPEGDGPKAGNTCFHLEMTFFISLAANHVYELLPSSYPNSFFCWHC